MQTLAINIRRYIKIYLEIIRLNYRRTLAQRGNFFSGLFGSTAWGIFSIVAVYVLSSRSSSVFGWTRAELFILIGVFNIMVGGTFRTLFARNFDTFPQLMSKGDLDGFLLKPVDAQFMVSTQYMSLYGVVRIAIAFIYTYFVLASAHVAITLASIIIFMILAIFGLIIIYSVWYFVMTFMVWFPDLHNLDEVLYSTDALTRYPPQVLWGMKIILLYVLFPFTLVVSTPTKALLHKLTFYDSFLLVAVACSLLFISRKFWKFALKSYSSASG